MSSTKANGKLDTIRALLAKAEDSSTPEAEAELARMRAFEMMAKYGVDRAMDDDKSSDDPLTDRRIDLVNPWAMQRVRLMAFIAESVGCKAIHLGKQGKGQPRQLHIFGYESDVHRAQLLYASLALQMLNGAGTAPRGELRPKAWRHSFMLGFIDRVTKRLREAEETARAAARGETSATGRSGALVLVDRATAVQGHFKEAYPKSGSQRGTYTGTGYGCGQAAGNRADLGGTRHVARRTTGTLTR